ncbi:bacteriophage protein [Ameyamaea chiangmaiensis NBRC 103196]|uniref:Baseplate J/gp47 family protein n=1 Tax=Ameyamaea chiangmaiensis TaxID=442969 RepID=A0A850PD93_9PROT|nr:baseplate J/gp47 family protein [Ameyamaea chiangmaiensis]MBS4075477.1 baseplate J/gp47 family protein [Ameyamaea chiangmaiensis]NVN38991.1 baseplate J/gp47 family protein [Ameyamaea chiangmaiensis]GBQ69626.1 bacteriophage protein [Ameyamaea chiangmaiensis NBRC 103196]
MPYSRPTLSELRSWAVQDVLNAGISGVSKVLRFSVLGTLAWVNAGLAWLVYGYLDWIAMQAVPWTATDEYLAAWGALKKVYRKAASAASGSVVFAVTGAQVIPSGTAVTVGGLDGTTTADSVTTGTSTVAAVTLTDTGATGNVADGSIATLGSPISGIQSTGSVSTAFTGGADAESNSALRSRVMAKFQESGTNGREQEYIDWATDVTGVTRAWINRNGFGAGSVVVYVMLDEANAAYSGFPQGTNGVASDETRYFPATGDQLRVANAIWTEQPVDALVVVCSPIAETVAFTISDLGDGNTTANQALIEGALDDMFLRLSAPGGTIHPNNWNEALGALGLASFNVTVPSAPVTGATVGSLLQRGTVTFVS